jgi:hypothetical protein
VASLAVAASGDRHFELPLPSVPHDGLELLNLLDIADPLHPGGSDAGDICPEQRVALPEQVVIGDNVSAGIQDESHRCDG